MFVNKLKQAITSLSSSPKCTTDIRKNRNELKEGMKTQKEGNVSYLAP